LGFDKDFERHPLRPGRITKVIEIPEEILDLEPDDRATVLAGPTVCYSSFVNAVQAGVPHLPPAMSTGRPLGLYPTLLISEVCPKVVVKPQGFPACGGGREGRRLGLTASVPPAAVEGTSNLVAATPLRRNAIIE